MKKDNIPQFICYLSTSKVDMLYSQITDFEVDKVKTAQYTEMNGEINAESPSIFNLLKAGLSFGRKKRWEKQQEGSMNDIQKLKAITEYYKRHKLFYNISKENLPSLFDRLDDKNMLYVFNAPFYCKYPSTSPVHDGGSKDFDYVMLTTKSFGYGISLACSFKYFCNKNDIIVNEGRSFDRELQIVDSSNYHYFKGIIPATFEAIFILQGKKGKTLYGSPLVLANCYSVK